MERNLRVPLAGIAQVAEQREDQFHLPTIFVRTGDTPPGERGRFQRTPADILITTPESLYLLLTSNAREALRSVETVIVDEIHALVPTKRGAHLALSLERLERLCGGKLQRIGLSATQRPLDEVARFLAGVSSTSELRAAQSSSYDEVADVETAATYRPVTVLDASAPKRLELSVQVPVEDMSKLGGEAGWQSTGRSVDLDFDPSRIARTRAHASIHADLRQ